MKKIRLSAILLLVAVFSVALMACPADIPPEGEDPINPSAGLSEAGKAFIAAVNLLPNNVADLKPEDESRLNEAQAKLGAVPTIERLDESVMAARLKLDGLFIQLGILKSTAEAKAFTDAVAALPAVTAVTIAQKGEVEAARDKFGPLSPAAKELADVKAANTKVTELLARIALLEEAKGFVDAVAALPAVADITVAKKPDVEAAQAKYGPLSPAAKELADVKAANTKVNDLLTAITAKEAQEFINAVTAAAAGDITFSNMAAIKTAAETADGLYKALSPAARAVDGVDTAYTALTARLSKISALESAKTAAENFLTAFGRLPSENDIGIGNKNAVTAAKNQYLLLNADAKSYPNVETANTAIDSLLTKIETLSVAAFINAVNNELPGESTVTVADKPGVAAATTLYNGLSADSKALANVVAAYNKITALSLKIAKLELIAKIDAEFAKYPRTNYLDAELEELDGLYEGAMTVIDGFTVIASVNGYNTTTLFNAIKAVKTKEAVLGEALTKVRAEVAALRAVYNWENNYSAENWLLLKGVFDKAESDVEELQTLAAIEEYSVASVKSAADLVAKLDPFRAGTASSQTVANAQYGDPTGGTLTMGRTNSDTGGRMWGVYADVDYLLVNVYAKIFDTTTLEHSAEWAVVGQLKFHWIWRTQPAGNTFTNTTTNELATWGWLVSVKFGEELEYNISGTTLTVPTGKGLRLYGGNGFTAAAEGYQCSYTNIGFSPTGMLQYAHGSDYRSSNLYSITTTLITKKGTTYGNSVESVRRNPTNAVWGSEDPLVTAITTFTNRVNDIGEVGYTQSSLDKLLAADRAYMALTHTHTVQMERTAAKKIELGEKWDDFADAEEKYIDDFLALVSDVAQDTPGITAGSDPEDVSEFLDLYNRINTVYNAEILAPTKTTYAIQLAGIPKILGDARQALLGTGYAEARLNELAFIGAVESIGGIPNVKFDEFTKVKIDYAKSLYAKLSGASLTVVAGEKSALDAAYVEYCRLRTATLPQINAPHGVPADNRNIGGPGDWADKYGAYGVTGRNSTANNYIVSRLYFFPTTQTSTPTSTANARGYVDFDASNTSIPATAGMVNAQPDTTSGLVAGTTYRLVLRYVDKRALTDEGNRICQDSGFHLVVANHNYTR